MKLVFSLIRESDQVVNGYPSAQKEDKNHADTTHAIPTNRRRDQSHNVLPIVSMQSSNESSFLTI